MYYDQITRKESVNILPQPMSPAYIKLKDSFKWQGLPIEFVEADDGAVSVELRERK